MKLEEVTKPFPPANMTHMHSLLLGRLLRSSAASLSTDDAKSHIRILTMIIGCVSDLECTGMGEGLCVYYFDLDMGQ